MWCVKRCVMLGLISAIACLMVGGCVSSVTHTDEQQILLNTQQLQQLEARQADVETRMRAIELRRPAVVRAPIPCRACN